MPRKTIEIERVKDKANHMLAESAPEMVGERMGIITMIESILMEAGNYRGFQYLPSEFLPAEEQTPTNVLRPCYDQSRRRYY